MHSPGGPARDEIRLKHTGSARLWRKTVQIGFLVLTFWIGYRFMLFVDFLVKGAGFPPTRPPGVEAFLPISSLVSLKYWIATGVFNRIHPAGLIILLAVCATGLLLKKGFCSWVCPFGLLSEFLAKCHVLVFGRYRDLPRWIDYPLRGVKYLVLAFFLWSVFAGMDALQMKGFIYGPYNRVADVKMLYFFTRMSSLTAWVLAALVILSIAVRFFWCRYLCPYGALLGGLSLASLFKVRREKKSCTDCGACTEACPARIDVHRAKTVRSDECHACFRCVDACPAPGTLSVSVPRKRFRLSPAAYAVLITGLFLLGSLFGRAAGLWHNAIPPSELRQDLHDIKNTSYSHGLVAPKHEPGERPKKIDSSH